MQSFVDGYNNTPLDDFDGLSPVQMDNLLRGEFHEGVVRINDSEAVYDQVPLVRMIELFLSMIDPEKGLKLTPAGYLPVAIVKALYADAPLKDDAIEAGITKLRLEVECEPVHLTRIISELAGYVRKQHGRLFLTRKGEAFRRQPAVLTALLALFGGKFNLGYLDGYESPSIAQVGYPYSLYLLSKYGAEKRPETFYAEKYFRAFPQLCSDDPGRDASCYGLRTFPRFFRYFGFLTVSDPFPRPHSIRKSDLMDRFVEILA
jgi:hypothetical protein